MSASSPRSFEKTRLAALILAALLFFALPHVAWASPFAVSSFSPTGEVAGPTEIRIVFNTAVVKSDEVGKTLAPGEMPLTFAPPLPGNGKWLDALTFLYQPTSGYLEEATEYRATIREDLKDLSGASFAGDRDYRFHTPPLRLLEARQIDFDVRNDYVDYELRFSTPVSPARLRGYTELLDGKGQPVPHTYLGTLVTQTPRLRVRADDGSELAVAIEAGLTPARGNLGLKERVSLTLRRDLSLKIGNAYAGSEYDGSFLYIETSSPVDLEKAASFIEVEPKTKLTLEAWGGRLRIGGDFKPRDRVLLTVRKGLPPIEGEALGEAWSRAFIIPDVEPSLSFETQGRFVSPLGESLMFPLSTVNIERLDVGVNRVYDNNVPYVMRNSWPYSAYDLSEEIFRKRYTIAASPNEKIRNAIDLEKILDGKKGLFEVYANNAGHWPGEFRIVNVTDLGGSAKVFEKGMLVWVNSISRGKPVSDARVDVYSNSNQLLESGRTDRQGVWKITLDAPWSQNLRPDLVVISKGDDTSVLRLENSIWNRGAPEYAGAPYPSGAYLGLCYTPRGVFRPGERVPIGVIVRDRTLALKEPFPVQVKVRTSLGREWETKTVELSELGMASTDIRLSEASPTGSWHAGVYIPGESRPIAETYFFVEDFAPPRIEVEVSSDAKELVGEENCNVSLFAQYLFGAPGDSLAYELEATYIPREYSHPNWTGYRFGDERKTLTPEMQTVASGMLDANGTVTISDLDIPPPFPAILDLSLRAGVMEDSGRWVYRTLTIPYYPADTLLGILLPQGTLTSESDLSFGFASIKTDGSPSLGPAFYTIYKQLSAVSIHERDGVTRGERNIRYEPLEGHEDVPVTFTDGKAEIKANLPTGGDYLIELTGPDETISTAASFYVYDARWNYGEGDGVLPDALTITLDKPLYRVGEKVRGRVTGAFEGSLLVSLETDSTLRHEVLTAGSDGGTFSFDVAKEMAPNAWITAQLIRPVLPEEDWRSHRAFGAVPLHVDNSDHSLTVEIQGPAKLFAEKANEISIQLKDHRGKGVEGEISVMLVDDGVLALTRFETPDFYRAYAMRRGLAIDVFDIYRDLIRLYPEYPTPLTPGGGMAEDAAFARMQQSLSPVRADRFRVLTICDAVKTDKTGHANLTVTLPEFTGRARLMAVAVAKTAFGAGEMRYEVADDIVADVSLPRALAPGDVFDSEIRIFNQTSADIAVSIDLSIQGALTLLENDGTDSTGASYLAKRTVRIDANPTVIPLRMKASEEAGVADISLQITFDRGEIRKTNQIAVRPPYPRITKSRSTSLPPGGVERLLLSDDWFPGTRRGLLAVSALPEVTISDLAKFLVGYPYHCLEQTVSSGWGMLAAPDLVAGIDPALASPTQLAESLDGRIRRIQASQLYSGAFAFWPGSPASDWATAYAAHFLVACEMRGLQLPGDILANAYAYLRQVLALSPSSQNDALYGPELATRAYIAYIMSIRGDVPHAWMSYLRDNLPDMPAYGRLLLAAAYARSGQKDLARAMLGESIPAIDQPTAMQQEKPNWDSPLRSTALSLLAWNEIDPMSPEAADAATILLEGLRANDLYTTQEASFALFSLATFYAHQEQSGESRIVIKSESGRVLLTQEKNKSYNIQLPPDITSLEARNTGTGTGYVAVVLDGVPTVAPEARNQGIRASVEYRDSSGTRIQPGTSVTRGERVTATITLAPLSAEMKNIVVTLPLAGGLEVENPWLMDAPSEGSYGDDNVSGARAELRDDRLLLFVDELSKPFTWRCAMRAVTAGQFLLPPIVAEGMYAPGLQSIGETSTLTIVSK
ncbi:hypothetical protein LJC31_02370 [Synergistaceae bacterium OttesenSCG-928-I11]|nr:hypothetical protein [Synergistaceae bacterium OttesenSCG-928-I11]